MRIGLMGGTFDPIHVAHLVAASEVYEALNLDQVIFIPAGNPWQKAGTKISPAETRLQMVDLAIQNDPRFISSDIEIKRSGETYAIDTVKELELENPGNDYFWIVGADALSRMPTWHDFSQLQNLIEIVAVNRNGINHADVEFDYTFVEMPEIAISATQIRNRIAVGKSIKYLVPDAVESFISKSGLYS